MKSTSTSTSTESASAAEPHAARGRVTGFAGFVRSVTNLNRAIAFYAKGLGFEPGPRETIERNADVDAVPAQRVRLTLGTETIDLVAPLADAHGAMQQSGAHATWPSVSSAAFQHLAIVASDIGAAIDRLQRFSPTLISQGAAVHLPARAGGVTAFKFRDPDGHPLELIAFPVGTGDPKWRRGGSLGPTLGIDHSAISVSDVPRSLVFYADALGFELSSQQVNSGREQDRLDGVDCVVVDVVGLSPSERKTPHLELLGYRTPTPVPREPLPPIASDRSDRLRWYVRDLAAIVSRIGSTNQTPLTHVGAADLIDRDAWLLRDPDGHLVELIQVDGI